MEKSVKNIIKSILTIILVIVVCLIYMNMSEEKNRKGIGIASRDLDINILEDTILCEDVIVFDITSAKTIDYDFIKDDTYLHNVKMTINNRDDIYSWNVENCLKKGSLYLDESFLTAAKLTENVVTIKLSYELDKDSITRYTDTDVLSYYMDTETIDYIHNVTININSRDTISNLATEKGKVTQIGNGYSITIDNLKKSTNIDIAFHINTDLNNIVGTEYIDKESLAEREEYSYINERFSALLALGIISIIGFILSCIINRKVRVKEYRRETSGLISPVLAEAIVDGKIGLKELIMTTIIELNLRGNIKIINNDMIELVSTNDLELYERDIVELLFKTNPIRFDDINNVFARSNQETLEFSKKMNHIKELILDKIYSMDIFSKKLTMVSKVIGLIAILICINLPLIFLENVVVLSEIFILISLLATIYYIKIVRNKTTIQEEIISDYNKKKKAKIKSKKSGSMIIVIILMLFIMGGTLIYVAKYHIVFLLITLIIFCLNIYNVYRSQSSVLTKQGRDEQAELLKLKKYINDYSLMKNRDLESVVLWDEYLAYATAFGIPNKVTDTIYEGWYNLNLNLQVIEKILD